MKKIIIISLSSLLFFTCDSKPKEVLGCTDAVACNYDSKSNVDNGSCVYAEQNFNCAGECTADTDCAGTCGGLALLDKCGVCNGNNSSCKDKCGVINGDNSSCKDQCGVVNGDNSTCTDECGVLNGSGIADGACDCDGNVSDCTGTCGGSAKVDECGLCGGNGPRVKFDCSGNCVVAMAPVVAQQK